jgi:hypothetical protein
MEKGELSGEPERFETSHSKPRPKQKVLESGRISSKIKPQRIQEESSKPLAEDDFFGDDDDEDEDS